MQRISSRISLSLGLKSLGFAVQKPPHRSSITAIGSHAVAQQLAHKARYAGVPFRGIDPDPPRHLIIKSDCDVFHTQISCYTKIVSRIRLRRNALIVIRHL
jgi:hypothetical protein